MQRATEWNGSVSVKGQGMRRTPRKMGMEGKQRGGLNELKGIKDREKLKNRKKKNERNEEIQTQRAGKSDRKILIERETEKKK